MLNWYNSEMSQSKLDRKMRHIIDVFNEVLLL